MSLYAITVFCVIFVSAFFIPPFLPAVKDEPTYTREDAESFANQLMWMGQDDGQ